MVRQYLKATVTNYYIIIILFSTPASYRSGSGACAAVAIL
jgi:hypothetical protein